MTETTTETDWGVGLREMRDRAPLVQNITNYVAMNIAANALLAAGASPAMLHAPQEAGGFAAIAQALTINIGTLSADFVAGMLAAAEGAQAAGTPWVLDPVAVGATAYRKETAARLLELGPAAIRGNASEILALAGVDAQGKGADAADGVAAAEAPARDLAKRLGCVVAVTGPVDFVTDGARAWRVANGDPMMTRVTAVGCSLTAVVGAFVAGAEDRAEATVAALAYFGLAGERAAPEAKGPASFQTAFIDSLYALTPEEVRAGAKVRPA